MAITVAELAAGLDGLVLGAETLQIDRARSLSKAGPGSITFFSGTKATGLSPIPEVAILVNRELRAEIAALAAGSGAFILVDNPEIGISGDAFVSATAQIGRQTNIHPGAFVGAGVVVGDLCDIHPGAVIGRGCRLGNDVVIHPNVVLYQDTIVGNRVVLHAGVVVGSDGFGYRTANGRHDRYPHFGNVRIEDDVEVGANSTIDRAMIDETVIGQGTKLDNLVMIGHNCEIGPHNLIVSQTGLAGSVTTGDHVVCAGQVGVADHVHLGSGCVLGAKAGVHKDVPAGERYVGVPAVPEDDCMRVVLASQKLPEMRLQLRKLERQVAELVAFAEVLRKQIGSADVAGVAETQARQTRNAA
jgi:UDP-3-O-[3-hydroxymyristoyl] glucosamine N-acyltransferase